MATVSVERRDKGHDRVRGDKGSASESFTLHLGIEALPWCEPVRGEDVQEGQEIPSDQTLPIGLSCYGAKSPKPSSRERIDPIPSEDDR